MNEFIIIGIICLCCIVGIIAFKGEKKQRISNADVYFNLKNTDPKQAEKLLKLITKNE